MHSILMRSCETPSDPTRSELPPWPLSRASVRWLHSICTSSPILQRLARAVRVWLSVCGSVRVRGICLLSPAILAFSSQLINPRYPLAR